MEKITQDMPFEPKKVISAIDEILSQGPGAINRITKGGEDAATSI